MLSDLIDLTLSFNNRGYYTSYMAYKRNTQACSPNRFYIFFPTIMSLESILNKSPRRKGRPRDDEAQPSTRGISAYDRKTLPANEFVHGVYYQENLLDQLLLRAKEKTQKVKIREEDWDLSAAMDVQILEKTTCTCLPRVINSGKDVQTILQSKLLAPALLGIAV